MADVRRWWAAVAVAAAAWLSAGDASALLLEKVDDYTVFYPYPTAFTGADPGYAFDDDPLAAVPLEPYALPLVVYDIPTPQGLVEPRTNFVEEMVDSGDAI
jgi:hypothetical protein